MPQEAVAVEPTVHGKIEKYEGGLVVAVQVADNITRYRIKTKNVDDSMAGVGVKARINPDGTASLTEIYSRGM